VKENHERLSKKLKCKNKALKNTTTEQLRLKVMENQNIEVLLHLTAFPKLLVLGEKDPTTT
jgi:hypothetical protein